MPLFIGCFVRTKGAIKKGSAFDYTRKIDAPNKKAASAILTAQFYTDHADKADDYFDVKVCEDRVGLSSPAPNEWDTTFKWNKETSEIELLELSTETDEIPESKSVMKMPTNFRAAVLALFGPVESITKAEYSRVIDLVNDDEPSPARELAEAISRTPRVFALPPEHQVKLLADTRAGVKEFAQWTDYKKFMDKRLDAPFEKRDAPAEVKPAAAPEYVSLTFEQKIAVAINAPTIELDEVTPEILSDATNQRKCEYPAFVRAHKTLTYIQPTLEKFSDRLLGSAIRSVDFNEDKGIVACRRAVLDYLGVTNEDATEQNSQNTADVLDNEHPESPELEEDAAGTGEHTQKVTTGRTIFTLDELTAGPDVKPCRRPAMAGREIEIIIAINDALSGAENIMSADDAAELIAAIGLPVHEVVAVLGGDFTAVDEQFLPAITDNEIYHLTLDLLEDWNQNPEQRRELICVGVEEWRQWEKEQAAQRCKNADSSTNEMVQKAESVNQSPLTYHQQLTIAALQGLCANPACFGVFDEIAEMAITLANATDRESD
ncbi:hypothetical protein [Buttiauxella gaviniae]|uniref:hypothetical protein n=1 Tax=Buttiauxella gaviniae TaxID=82990 RepID=UPI0039770F5A